MNIRQATRSYERWLRGCTRVIESELRSKHEQMREDLLLFFRGTFYRWAQVWPEQCRDLSRAPKILAVGDLHVGSFGTWRDLEGRLAWGVDDFDDSYPLPYTNDLVRLAASVKILIDSEKLTIKLKDGCNAILEGYEQTLKNGGCPIVLAEHETNLQKLGIEAFKPPEDFWEKLDELPTVRQGLPADCNRALREMLPDRKLKYKVVHREAGMGSLGQERFVALAWWQGGFIAREAKATTPSSCAWLHGHLGHQQSYYERIMDSALRSHDAYQKVVGRWIVRRLSPESNPIELSDLPAKREEDTLLHAMGSEAANVHLGSHAQFKNVLKDLRRRKANWLRTAAKDMAKCVERDWKDYKRG